MGKHDKTKQGDCKTPEKIQNKSIGARQNKYEKVMFSAYFPLPPPRHARLDFRYDFFCIGVSWLEARGAQKRNLESTSAPRKITWSYLRWSFW
jgi:hypothetical protein